MAGPRLSATYSAWSKGPVRWLLLPEESHAYARLGSDLEAEAFIVQFWRRRDPDPDTPQNPVADRFSERVAMADQIYGEGKRRGAMTERGGALILLGPPTYLRASARQKPLPASRDAAVRPTVPVLVETWGYPASELPNGVPEILGRQTDERIELQFVIENDRSYLASGKEVLAAAARAALVAE
jgi:GWxTD domain-containing protein